MESRQRRVSNQAAGERALIRASRDAMRDFVIIEYNARARLCHTKPAAWITKKEPLSVDKGYFLCLKRVKRCLNRGKNE